MVPRDGLRTVTTAPEGPGTQFRGWSRQTDPDSDSVAALYRDGATEREIARILAVSRRRVADALAAAGIERRPAARTCPVDDAELRRLYQDEHFTQAQLAERLKAAPGTVGRWLAECGIGAPDPRIDHGQLRQRYLDEHATTREIATELGVSHNRVIRELALAGISRRSRHDRRPSGPRAALTCERMAELYVERGLSVRELTDVFGVSDEYVRKRLRECGLAKRPGSFHAKLDRDRGELASHAAELYSEAGLSLRAVGAELKISASLVRELLHETGVAVRPPGVPPQRADKRQRRILRDLYADAEVADVLRRFDVPLQDPAAWERPSPFHSFVELPLPAALVEELYVRLGLSAFHVSLLCGVGSLTVLNRLRALGMECRPSGQPCPWTLRTYG